MDSKIGNLELTVQDLDSNTQSCNMCDFKWKTMPGLKTNMTLKCKSEQKYSNKVGFKEFYEKVNPNPADEIYLCNKCNIRFLSNKDLSQHNKAMHRASLTY